VAILCFEGFSCHYQPATSHLQCKQLALTSEDIKAVLVIAIC